MSNESCRVCVRARATPAHAFWTDGNLFASKNCKHIAQNDTLNRLKSIDWIQFFEMFPKWRQESCCARAEKSIFVSRLAMLSKNSIYRKCCPFAFTAKRNRAEATALLNHSTAAVEDLNGLESRFCDQSDSRYSVVRRALTSNAPGSSVARIAGIKYSWAGVMHVLALSLASYTVCSMHDARIKFCTIK